MPYHKDVYYDLVMQLVENGKITKSGIIVCEHAKEVALPENYGPFQLIRQETYGAAVVSIYRYVQEEGETID